MPILQAFYPIILGIPPLYFQAAFSWQPQLGLFFQQRSSQLLETLRYGKKSNKTMMGAQFADMEEHILTLHFICQMLVGHNVQMPSPCCQPASSALS